MAHHLEQQPPSALIVDLAKGYGGAEVRVLDTAKSLHGRYPYTVATLTGSPLHQRLEAAGLSSLAVPLGRADARLLFFLVRFGVFFYPFKCSECLFPVWYSVFPFSSVGVPWLPKTISPRDILFQCFPCIFA